MRSDRLAATTIVVSTDLEWERFINLPLRADCILTVVTPLINNASKTKAFLDKLGANPQVKHINLAGGKVHMASFAEFLQTNTTLETVILEGDQNESYEYHKLAEALAKNKTVRNFNLSRTKAPITFFDSTLANNRSLTYFVYDGENATVAKYLRRNVELANLRSGAVKFTRLDLFDANHSSAMQTKISDAEFIYMAEDLHESDLIRALKLLCYLEEQIFTMLSTGEKLPYILSTLVDEQRPIYSKLKKLNTPAAAEAVANYAAHAKKLNDAYLNDIFLVSEDKQGAYSGALEFGSGWRPGSKEAMDSYQQQDVQRIIRCLDMGRGDIYTLGQKLRGYVSQYPEAKQRFDQLLVEEKHKRVEREKEEARLALEREQAKERELLQREKERARLAEIAAQQALLEAIAKLNCRPGVMMVETPSELQVFLTAPVETDITTIEICTLAFGNSTASFIKKLRQHPHIKHVRLINGLIEKELIAELLESQAVETLIFDGVGFSTNFLAEALKKNETLRSLQILNTLMHIYEFRAVFYSNTTLTTFVHGQKEDAEITLALKRNNRITAFRNGTQPFTILNDFEANNSLALEQSLMVDSDAAFIYMTKYLNSETDLIRVLELLCYLESVDWQHICTLATIIWHQKTVYHKLAAVQTDSAKAALADYVRHTNKVTQTYLAIDFSNTYRRDYVEDALEKGLPWRPGCNEAKAAFERKDLNNIIAQLDARVGNNTSLVNALRNYTTRFPEAIKRLKKVYFDAANELRNRAEKGSQEALQELTVISRRTPESMFHLGRYYETRNKLKAYECYSDAKDAVKEAMFGYGLFLLTGVGYLKPSPVEGLKCIYRAAQEELPEAVEKLIHLADRREGYSHACLAGMYLGSLNPARRRSLVEAFEFDANAFMSYLNNSHSSLTPPLSTPQQFTLEQRIVLAQVAYNCTANPEKKLSLKKMLFDLFDSLNPLIANDFDKKTNSLYGFLDADPLVQYALDIQFSTSLSTHHRIAWLILAKDKALHAQQPTVALENYLQRFERSFSKEIETVTQALTSSMIAAPTSVSSMETDVAPSPAKRQRQEDATTDAVTSTSTHITSRPQSPHPSQRLFGPSAVPVSTANTTSSMVIDRATTPGSPN